MKPAAIADLDTALTHYAQSQQNLGMPVVNEPPSPIGQGM